MYLRNHETQKKGGCAAGKPVCFLTLERYLLTFAPLTATPYRDGRRIRRSSLRTNVLLRALTVVPSRNSDARSVMLRIPLPEYADGTLKKPTANRGPIPLSLSLFFPFTHGTLAKHPHLLKAQSRHRGAVRPFPSPCGLGRISSSAMTTLRLR